MTRSQYQSGATGPGHPSAAHNTLDMRRATRIPREEDAGATKENYRQGNMAMRHSFSRRDVLRRSALAAGAATGFRIGPLAHGRGVSAQGSGVVTDTVQHPIAETPKPGYLADYTDPAFGSTVIRITGDPGDPIPNGDGADWPSVARHGYSKRAVWNSTQTMLAFDRVELPGGGGIYFFDGSTYQALFRRSVDFTEQRWSPRPDEADLMYWVQGSSIGTWNVVEDESTTIATFPQYKSLRFGPWEGNLSHDGRWVVLNGKRKSNNKPVAFAYNLERDEKHPDIALSKWRRVDWASISPLGTYVVVHGAYAGTYDQTRIYTIAGELVGYWRERGQPSHYDLTVDPDGEVEVAVGGARSGPLDGEVIKRRLDTGQITQLTAVGSYASHTSARNLDRPGWAYVTYEWDSGPYRFEIVAVNLDGTVAERYAQTRNRRNPDFLGEAHGSPSPDGQRVLFASSWEADRPVQAYVADVRSLR